MARLLQGLLSPIPHARARAWASLGALATLAATWLFVPRPAAAALPTRPGLALAVVDVSASAAGPRPEWSRWVRGELARVADRARAGQCELMVVEYAAAPAVVFGPGPPERWSERLEGRDGSVYQPGNLAGAGSTAADGRAARAAAPDWGSDLAAALALGEPELAAPGRAPGQLVVLCDGAGTGPSPLATLERLAASGATLAAPPAPPPSLSDLGLARLLLPRRVAAGTGARVGLELLLDRPPGAAPLEPTLELEVRRFDTDALAFSRRVGCPAPAGKGVHHAWTVELELDPLPDGLYELRVRGLLLDPSPGATGNRDWMPWNDRAAGLFAVGHRPRIALLAHPPQAARAFAERQRKSLDCVLVEPQELEQVAPFVDALFTIDQPASELPASAVRELLARGGGWLDCVGWRSLLDAIAAQDAAPGTTLHELLPLAPAPGASEERDIVLLVDGSGSMAGEPFERVREAVRELALGARPADHVQLRFFTGVLGPVAFESFGATRAERAERLVPLMRATTPGGPTDVLHALETLAAERAREREAGPAAPALALLLTDGYTNYDRDRPLAVREALAASGCDLRILAVGTRPDRAFLRSLLFAGEELVEAGDLSRLVLILSEEINRDLLHEDPGARLVFAAPAEFAAASLERELVRAPWTAQQDGGQQAASASGLPRLARMRLREGARELARSSTGHPAAAFERGGGSLVALAAAPWGDFQAPDLERREVWLVEVLLALAEPAAEPEAGPRLELRGRGLELEQAPPGSGPWIARLLGPNAESVEVELLPPLAAGSGGGTFRAALPEALARRSAGERWSFELVHAGEEHARGRGWFWTPAPREFLPPDWSLPAELPPPSSRPPPSATPSPWAVPVLVLGMGLLFASGWTARRQGPAVVGRQRNERSPPNRVRPT